LASIVYSLSPLLEHTKNRNKTNLVFFFKFYKLKMLNHEFIWLLVIVVASVSVQRGHHQVDGLVWSLVLGNPVVDMSAAGEGESLSASSSSSSSSSSETSEDYDYDDQQQQRGILGDDSTVLMPQHPRNTRPKLPGSRPTRHHLSHVSGLPSSFERVQLQLLHGLTSSHRVVLFFI
jgi:hypothetical protein